MFIVELVNDTKERFFDFFFFSFLVILTIPYYSCICLAYRFVLLYYEDICPQFFFYISCTNFSSTRKNKWISRKNLNFIWLYYKTKYFFKIIPYFTSTAHHIRVSGSWFSNNIYTLKSKNSKMFSTIISLSYKRL